MDSLCDPDQRHSALVGDRTLSQRLSEGLRYGIPQICASVKVRIDLATRSVHRCLQNAPIFIRRRLQPMYNYTTPYPPIPQNSCPINPVLSAIYEKVKILQQFSEAVKRLEKPLFVQCPLRPIRSPAGYKKRMPQRNCGNRDFSI